MKIKVGVVIVIALGCLVFATSASAFQWRMRYGQAKHESKRLAGELCEELRECTGYGVGQCYRRSLSRFDCEIGLFYPGYEVGEETECNEVLHWGVNYQGTIVLKNSGEPNCFTTA